MPLTVGVKGIICCFFLLQVLTDVQLRVIFCVVLGAFVCICEFLVDITHDFFISEAFTMFFKVVFHVGDDHRNGGFRSALMAPANSMLPVASI